METFAALPARRHPIKWEEIIMANEKILVVDDDTNICELLRLYLTKEAIRSRWQTMAKKVWKSSNQVKPDMVLLDVMMPRWTVWKCAAASARRATPR